MTADQFLSLAEALRSFTQHSGRDTNASNLFVHAMLMRAIRAEQAGASPQEAASQAQHDAARAA